ncbi:hypothetical protein H0B56_15115 [Haloechinothrix sp. YIM 98757]|uniref:Uncharacterized protein n=1 Tax=Haloechinothrix aidingensis TaxID=2752311 RepID=A0A838AC89_9PSEU|nr:hypothetical protein [Haloechinothrix aidingensis]MBA0126879.1 hypothetical protein [Haloechinothrix aidingensis]
MRDVGARYARRWSALAARIRRRWGPERLPERVLPVLLGAVLLAIPVAVMVGSTVHDRQLELSHAEHEARSQVTAQLLEDARSSHGVAMPVRMSDNRPGVRATWPSPHGPGRQEGTITVRAGMTEGMELPIWVDSAGEPVEPPLTPEQAQDRATGTGIALWLVVAAGSVALYWVVRVIARGPSPRAER